MVAHINTVAFSGIDTTPVDVQVHISAGMPGFLMVGLPDKAVAESRERVRSALTSLGLPLPAKKILVNLAPADLIKEGSHFDLAVAIGLLVAMGVLPASEMANYIALGELTLDGHLLPVGGVLPAAIAAAGQGKGIICPAGNGAEAAWAGQLDVLAPTSLLSLINHFKGTQVLSPPDPYLLRDMITGPDLAEVKGQESAKRALEVAAAGGHNLLMAGPPGAGKSMLASCLPGILPPLKAQEILEISAIASVAGKLTGGKLTNRRPFRDPHHSSSMAAMVGGGRKALPGEISLAHHGVLFLDELPEFPRAVLESLRQPLESGIITVARAQAHVTYPARVQLIAAMNPCRCGYLGDASRACGKAPRCAVEYQSKLSGPLLDRIDMHIEVSAVGPLDMIGRAPGERSVDVAARVAAARDIQWARYETLGESYRSNASVSGDLLMELAMPEGDARRMVEEATHRLQLSMRGLTRVLRVARTIADLDQAPKVQMPHVAEALSYRHTIIERHTQPA
jgi:magnesium chelatase family protein